jgi:tetratricopeptide (TPR) repeat protein
MLIPCLLVFASLPAQDESSFLARLAEARSALEKRDWKKAEAAALGAIAENERKPYVWLHLPELRDVVESASFGAKYVEPDPKTLISGELVSYSKSGANLKVRYTPKTLGDFETESTAADALRIHPVVFAGAYTIEVKGSSYPHGSKDALIPMVVFGIEERDGQAVGFGFTDFREGNRIYSAPATLRVRQGGEWVDGDESTKAACRSGAPFDLKVKVEDTRVTVTSGGKQLLTGKKRSDVLGQFGFGGFTRFDELVVSGRAQPAWLQGKIDEHLQKAWENHAETLRKKSPFPEWLTPVSCGASTMIRFDTRDLPVELNSATVKKLSEILETKPGKVKQALASLEALDAKQVPDSLRAWVAAVVHYNGRHLAESLTECEKAVVAFPDFVAAKRLRARLLLRLQRADEAHAAARELVTAAPDDDRAAADLAEIEFATGRFDELAALLRERAERGRFTLELDAANSLYSRAKNGPGWTKPIEVQTAHYTITSDIDRKTCVEAGEMLESSLARFEARLRPLPKDRVAPFRVYLFSGFAGYRRYVRDALDARADNTAGMYHMDLEQLLIWNLPDHEQMLRTVRHEGLHQYVDRCFGDLPRWLNEGLAELYENAEFTRGPSRELRTHPEHLRTLRASNVRPVPLADFVRMDAEEFYEDAELHYAEAWALVHFLMTGPPERKAIADALLRNSLDDMAWEESVDAVFEPFDMVRLGREFREYIDALEE